VKQQRVTTRSRRRAVLDSALECFSEADVDSVSIADICARSGASVGSLYHHFGSKEGIVVALIADGLQAHLHALQAALDEAGGDPRRGVEAVVGSLIDWIESNPGWAMFIYANLNKSTTASAAPIREVNRRYGQIVEGFFLPLIEAGRIRPLPRECWSSLVAAPIHDYARRWLRGQVKIPPHGHRDIFLNAVWAILKNDDNGQGTVQPDDADF